MADQPTETHTGVLQSGSKALESLIYVHSKMPGSFGKITA